MQTPDLCSALIRLIERDFHFGRHLDVEGKPDPDWLYACLAMAAIGHSQRDRYAAFAAAAIGLLYSDAKAALLLSIELPPAVARLLLDDSISFPQPQTPPQPAAPYTPPDQAPDPVS
ncbi:hypothetical protein [Azospirillum thermophilum]|uniref:Uncharacterized protein n=1 Tax=Azospirillum thermophilum TaxID=2202148 RepID=A0A2S2D0Q3_9PROT|nr:hypothetical protein [Azospirillum thermophilum]AWK90341.1 hypothetical protein DEW08_30460 [Azospirillum thermophilum]